MLAFWSDAAVLLHFGEHATMDELVDELIAIPPSGLTNVAFPLEVAARELRERPAASGRVLLLSDCVHNAGPDPRGLAARLGRLDVLLDATGEQDPELARDLARTGRGLVAPVHGFGDIAPALERLLAYEPARLGSRPSASRRTASPVPTGDFGTCVTDRSVDGDRLLCDNPLRNGQDTGRTGR